MVQRKDSNSTTCTFCIFSFCWKHAFSHPWFNQSCKSACIYPSKNIPFFLVALRAGLSFPHQPSLGKSAGRGGVWKGPPTGAGFFSQLCFNLLSDITWRCRLGTHIDASLWNSLKTAGLYPNDPEKTNWTGFAVESVVHRTVLRALPQWLAFVWKQNLYFSVSISSFFEKVSQPIFKSMI